MHDNGMFLSKVFIPTLVCPTGLWLTAAVACVLPVDSQPDTQELDQSEIRTQILLAIASSGLKARQSFTCVEQGRCQGSSFSHRVGLGKTIAIPFNQNIHLYDTSRGRFNLKHWSHYTHWGVYVCSVDGDSETHTELDHNPDKNRFCVFSLAASTDGKEVIGEANDGCFYVIDREQNKRTLKIKAHDHDVNTAAFADSSSQLLFSGSDDALCKVWDRKIQVHYKPPLFTLQGDARYLICNSKDQSIRLWDMRKFSPMEGLVASRLNIVQQDWDYRWQLVAQNGAGETMRLLYIFYDVLMASIVTRLSDHYACVRDVSWRPYQDIISSSVSLLGRSSVCVWEHRQTHLLDEERYCGVETSEEKEVIS
uniref:Ddb1 and cul4 associated factor 11 n=1 Tax=Salmo trutta TaxID=8032 RepID=A0A673XIP8_SALTR